MSKYAHRGVHAGHPAIDFALRGEVRPGDPDGTVSAEEHNLGGCSARSPFTSWSHKRDIADWHARTRGPGGVLLVLPTGAPSVDDIWSWEWSPDEYYEYEVLLRGIRLDAEVIQI